MSARKVFVWLFVMLAALCVCLPAAYAEAIGTVLPERVEIGITEADGVEKLGKGEYCAVVYPDWEELVISGIWDGENRIMISLYSAGCETAGWDFIKYEDGTWQCTIPVDILTPNAHNVFSIWYADEEQEPVTCEIILDFVCELELDDVYAAEKRVTGTTEPGAEVYMYAGDTEYHTVTGDDGTFWFDVDFSGVESTDDWLVKAVDVYGNTAELGVTVIEAEITVSAPALITGEKMRVDFNAIPGSSVQIVINGENWGEPATADRHGNGHKFVVELEHGCEYEISAVYTSLYEGYADAAQPVKITVDARGPVICAADEFLYVGTEEFTIDADEAGTLVITESATGFEYTLACEAGGNTVEIGSILDLEYGMEISVRAVDAAGNYGPEAVILDVRLPAEELVHFENMSIEDGYTVDAMEAFSLECVAYVPDIDCGLNLYVVDEDTGDMALLNSAALSAVDAPEGAPLPAMVPVRITVDAAELPMDHRLGIGFCTVYADGSTDDAELWPKLSLTLEKNYAKLAALCGMLVLALACFAAAAWMYAKVNRKQRELRRSAGALKDGRRGRKRGGAWA